MKETFAAVCVPGALQRADGHAGGKDTTNKLMAFQDSDDIRYMVGALKALGVELEEDWPSNRLTVTGCAGAFPNGNVDLNLGNAGTAMRPLVAAVAAAGNGKYVLDGVERMRERPIGDLISGLRQLGAPLRIPFRAGLLAWTWKHLNLCAVLCPASRALEHTHTHTHGCVASVAMAGLLWLHCCGCTAMATWSTSDIMPRQCPLAL